MAGLRRIATLMLLALASAPAPIAAQQVTDGAAAARAAVAEVGDEHLWLSKKTGQWEAQLQLATGPGDETLQGRASVSRRMELGGRVLAEYWNGEIGGRPFEGVRRTGYDNVSGEFWSTWTDTESTALYVSRGERVPDAGQIELSGEYTDPVTNRRVGMEAVWTFVDVDREIIETHEVRNGEKRRVERIVMARVEASEAR